MAFQPIADAGQAVVRGTLADGRRFMNVFGISIPGAWNQGVADAYAESLSDAYEGLAGGMNANTVYNDVVLTDLRTEGAPSFESTSGAWPIFGTDSAQELPFQTAAVVTWRTALRGKSFTGRTYLGGFTEAFSDGRDISATLLTAINAWATSILTDLPGDFGVISRRHNDEERLIGVFTPFTGFTVRPFWRTQRRRAK